jgi:hypothetical protein
VSARRRAARRPKHAGTLATQASPTSLGFVLSLGGYWAVSPRLQREAERSGESAAISGIDRMPLARFQSRDEGPTHVGHLGDLGLAQAELHTPRSNAFSKCHTNPLPTRKEKAPRSTC